MYVSYVSLTVSEVVYTSVKKAVQANTHIEENKVIKKQ